jgi:hypothetical protein
MRRLLVVAALCFSANAVADVWTNTQGVTRIQYDGSSNSMYVVGAAKWGATGCVNATYAWIKPDVPGRKELLALTMAAQTAGKTVKFQGTCNSDLDYFEACYVVVE